MKFDTKSTYLIINKKI